MISFAFELADYKVEIEGKALPAFTFKDINFVGGIKAALTKLAIAAGLGDEEIDLKDFVGKAVSLNIVNNESKDGRIFSNVKEIAGLSKRVADSVPELVADSYFFDFDEPSAEIAAKLGKGMKARIQKANNYSGSEVEALFKKLNLEEKQTTEARAVVRETTSDIDKDII